MPNLPLEYQEQLLAVVPKFTGFIGMVSNILLMGEILLAHGTWWQRTPVQRGDGNPMLRSLGLVAFFLNCDALGWFLSTWAVPKGSFAFSAGNVKTCEFQGFLLNVVVGAPLFCCAMTFYFWLIVCQGKTGEDLWRYERILAPVIVLYAFSSSFFLLGRDLYNQVGQICWVIGSPPGCENSSFQPGDFACDRGNWAWLYGMVMFYVPLWSAIVLIGYFNFSIYWNLRRGGDREEASWFSTQSLLYALAFVSTWAPSTIWSTLSWKASGSVFAVDLLSAFFEPIGGLWNLMIFLRSRPCSQRRITRLLCFECWEEPEEGAGGIDADGPPPPPKKKVYRQVLPSDSDLSLGGLGDHEH